MPTSKQKQEDLYREVFLRKAVLKICSQLRGDHSCRSAISIKLQSSFIEITLRHECFPVNLLHIFRIPFPRKTSGWLLLEWAMLRDRRKLLLKKS